MYVSLVQGNSIQFRANLQCSEAFTCGKDTFSLDVFLFSRTGEASVWKLCNWIGEIVFNLH